MGATPEKPARTVAESEKLYERVLEFFWRDEEHDFIVRLADTPMGDWEMVPTPTPDEMIAIRTEYSTAKVEFAGFVHHEGRYCYYFCDRTIFKVQYLDNLAVEEFWVDFASEVDERAASRELKALIALLQGP